MEVALAALGLMAFGALVGRVWVLAVVAMPFLVLALLLAVAGSIEDRDLGTIEGTSIAGPVLLIGLGAVVASAVGVALGAAARAARRTGRSA